MTDCTWDAPGADPYRGTARAEQADGDTEPEQVRLTLNRAKEVLAYDPITGAFTRVRFTNVNGPLLGRPAGCKAVHGYLVIRIDYQLYYAHRLAFLLMTGEWPAEMVDHINGDRSDNRWANLRDVCQSTNMHNTHAATKATSGRLGVSKTPDGKKWRARIRVDGKEGHLGRFKCMEQAHAASMLEKSKVTPGVQP